jgi:TonB family protein
MNSSMIRTLVCSKRSVIVIAAAGLFFCASDIVAQSTSGPSGAIASSPKDGTTPAIPWAQMSIDVLSDTRGVDFGPYLKHAIQAIRKSWIALLPDEARPPYNLPAETIIRFTINPDGKITAMHLDTNSQQVKIDRAAWGAITSIGQFPPLPANFSGPNLELRVHFRVDSPATINP